MHSGEVRKWLVMIIGYLIASFVLQVFPGTRLDVIDYLESQNFHYIGNLFDDLFIRKDLLGVKYNIDYEAVKKYFPLFSREKELEILSIFNKFTGYDMTLKEDTNICIWNQEMNFLNSLFSIKHFYFTCPSVVQYKK